MKLKVGDKVRIRDWDDLVNEFGVDACGDIDNRGFTKGMKQFCGMETIIEEIDKPFDEYWFYLKNCKLYAFVESELIKEE